MNLEQRKRITDCIQNNYNSTFSMTFDDFVTIEDDILLSLKLNNEGLTILYDKEATILFDNAPNVIFIVRDRKFLFANRFKKFSLTTQGAKVPIRFPGFLIGEIKIHWKMILIIMFILGPFLIIQDSKDFIKELNTAVISATSILVGVFLVFVTFFYFSRQHELRYFSEGRFYTHFKNDKYIITCSFISLICSISSIGVSHYSFDKNTTTNLIYESIFFIHKWLLTLQFQKEFSGVLSILSMIFFWITFRAMTDYYFIRIKNSVYLDSLKLIQKEYINKKTKNDK
jgi:hypothetical protein